MGSVAMVMKRLCDPRAGLDPARAQPHHAIAALRQRGVVGHQHQRHAALGMLGEQEIDDLLAGGLIEIAGRLVRHQDRGVGASARASATRCCSPPDNCVG